MQKILVTIALVPFVLLSSFAQDVEPVPAPADAPNAFESGRPATYHAQAVEKLRMYVRLLGGSLKHKNSAVLDESVKTYSNFAEQTYCEAQPLIPTEEQRQVLAERLTPGHRRRATVVTEPDRSLMY